MRSLFLRLAKAAALTSNDVLREIADSFVFDRQNALVEVPYSHTTDHCKIGPMNTLTYGFLNFCICLAVAQLCTDPVYDTNSLKYRVFYDLWRRGKFITPGDAFGADFLVYPGDPLIYHASHIVIIQSTPAIRPLQLISKLRLSVIVNKSCVFAYERSGGSKEIAYQTVSWCNPSK